MLAQDLSSSLSLADSSFQEVTSEVFDNFETSTKHSNGSELDLEDRFALCGNSEIEAPTDCERLRFLLECFGLSDTYPEMLSQRISYEQLQSIQNDDQINELQLSQPIKKQLAEALSSRKAFSNTVEKECVLVDAYI